jgi:drug/metabolite transporter (DMT)-like permease
MPTIPGESSRIRPFLTPPELAIVAVTIVWGTTFLIVHQAMRLSGPLFFVGVRMSAAGLLSAALLPWVGGRLTRLECLGGAGIGVAIFAGYALQAQGLKTLDGSTSAFITALYVPMVPLLQWLVMRRAPRRFAWLGIVLAFVGLLVLTAPSGLSLSLASGELVTLLATLAIAAEIVLIGHLANRVDSRRVVAVQLLVAGLLCFAAMPVAGERIPDFSWPLTAIALGLAGASAIIQWVMNWAQKSVSPTRATLLYAAEPVWAAFFGRLAGEREPASAWWGAALIVIGVLVSELETRAPPKPTG